MAEQTQGSPVSLNQDSPRESKAEFSALLIQPVGLAGSWKGAVSLKEHQFPHPSPRHHSWEVRLQETWSYKRRGGARGRGMFLHSSLCRGGERWGDPFHLFPSPAEHQVSHALPCFVGRRGITGMCRCCRRPGILLPLLPHPFSSVPHWRRTGLTGQAVFALEAPHFHGELLRRSERSHGGLGAV